MFYFNSASCLLPCLLLGLLILSNSSLQRNGAIFGEGIYLSSDPAVALGYSKAGTGWECSYFGQRARYLLLCEVAKGGQVLCSNTPNLKHEKKDLGTYIIVQNCDLVKLRFIFVYVEPCRERVLREFVKEETQDLQTKSSGFPSLRRINWCKVMIVFYVVLLMGIAYLNSPHTTKFGSKPHRKPKGRF